MAIGLGADLAKQIADTHEATGEGSPDDQMMRQMDLANNHYGREIGTRYAEQTRSRDWRWDQ